MNSPKTSRKNLIRFHLMCGFLGLVLSVLLGLVLESLHAFKVPLYLDPENETRRLMWRLAHAHGALLSLLHLGLSWTFDQLGDSSFPQPASSISKSLIAALILLPAGFFVGGMGAVDGDPGPGIALVPVGAVFLLAGTVWGFVAVKRLPRT